MTILVRPLARCLFPGCPVRYASGGDRLCGDHDASNDGAALLGLAELTGEHGDGDGASRGT